METFEKPARPLGETTDSDSTTLADPDRRSCRRSETIYSGFGFFKRWRRQLLGRVYCLPDTGWFGLTPLRTHLVVCGFRRSGTTLMQMMLEYALPDARRFGREMSAWRAATYQWRNHAVMISKAPDDIFKLQGIFNFYETRPAQLRAIIMIRDPRDVLTSRHVKTGPERYFVDVEMWTRYRSVLRSWLDSPEALVVRYEDLVTDTPGVQRRIDQFTGEESAKPFLESHQDLRSDFDRRALNGLRPVDARTVGRWRNPGHRERVQQILRTHPDFGETLIELGYETSTEWIADYRASNVRPNRH